MRIAFADERTILREGFVMRLDEEPDMDVRFEVGHADGLIGGLEREPVDVVVMDIDLPGGQGIQLISSVKAIHPECRIVVFADPDLYQGGQVILEAGADGCIDRVASFDDLVRVLRNIDRFCVVINVTSRSGTDDTEDKEIILLANPAAALVEFPAEPSVAAG